MPDLDLDQDQDPGPAPADPPPAATAGPDRVIQRGNRSVATGELDPFSSAGDRVVCAESASLSASSEGAAAGSGLQETDFT